MKPINQMREVVVAGIGLTKFGFYPELESYDLGAEVIFKVLKDAEMEWKDIQAAFCGSVYQGTGSGHQAIKEVGLTGIPIVNVENACSSGASAFRLAYQAVATELYDIVLAFGIEKMPRGPIPSNAFRPWELSSGFKLQVSNYANESIEYSETSGATVEDFAMVTVKNRRNGVLNPNAKFQKEVTIDDVMNSRIIATPLRLFHCCPLADGASAVILCSKDKIKSKSRAIKVASAVITSGIYGEGYMAAGMTGSLKYPCSISTAELSAKEAYELAGIGPEGIDVAQVYDTMASSELADIEEMGLCKPGDAPALLRSGTFNIDGKIPINTDGGLIARGHPLGATAGAQICEIVIQLRGEAGERQVKNAKVGLSHSMGAGPNSSVVILKH